MICRGAYRLRPARSIRGNAALVAVFSTPRIELVPRTRSSTPGRAIDIVTLWCRIPEHFTRSPFQMLEDNEGIDDSEALLLMLWRRVSAHSRIAEAALHPDMELRRQLGILPVDALEIFDDISERYGITAPPAQVRRAETLGDLESILLPWVVPELYPISVATSTTTSGSDSEEFEHLFLTGIGFCIVALLGGSKILLAIGIVQLAIGTISHWVDGDRAPGGSAGDAPPPSPPTCTAPRSGRPGVGAAAAVTATGRRCGEGASERTPRYWVGLSMALAEETCPTLMALT